MNADGIQTFDVVLTIYDDGRIKFTIADDGCELWPGTYTIRIVEVRRER